MSFSLIPLPKAWEDVVVLWFSNTPLGDLHFGIALTCSLTCGFLGLLWALPAVIYFEQEPAKIAAFGLMFGAGFAIGGLYTAGLIVIGLCGIILSLGVFFKVRSVSAGSLAEGLKKPARRKTRGTKSLTSSFFFWFSPYFKIASLRSQ